ncbi:condensation domain-containing protein [Saccharothrix yanglingensis]|uniref:condensation domain-containing protein n=1 Tax=Saccharothrix yanglingensis TaxID=659496 RepID=UPI0027D212C0|nr:condensation domain-containing protein [Saccharothrix yanglingensis]
MSTTRPASLWQRFALVRALGGGVSTGPHFTLNAVLRVEGEFDVRALVAAAGDLVARHELLRTRLDLDAAVQVVEDAVVPDVEVLDDPAAVDVLHRPVLSTAPTPLALRVARRSPREHVLSAHLHHLLGDPATLWRLLDDLGALYSARCGAPEPEPPTGQFGDFAEFEAEVERAHRAEAEAWWGGHLGGSRFAVPPPVVGEPYARRRTVLAAEDQAALESRARALRGSPFAALTAVLVAGMAEHATGGDRVVFSTLFLRRDHPRWRTLAGPCITPSYLVVPFDATADVRGLTAAAAKAQRFSRYPVWELEGRVPGLDEHAPFVELIPPLRPGTIPFGPARAVVERAAGSRDDGRPAKLGLRLRKDDAGSLVAHVSGDGAGWTEPIVDAVLDGVAGRSRALGATRAPAR